MRCLKTWWIWLRNWRIRKQETPRFGIELLWRAGKYADASDTGALAPECVRQAMSSIVPSMRRSELESLGLHERMFLLAVARYFKENEDAYAPLSELEKEYGVICEEFEEQPNSHTQYGIMRSTLLNLVY